MELFHFVLRVIRSLLIIKMKQSQFHVEFLFLYCLFNPNFDSVENKSLYLRVSEYNHRNRHQGTYHACQFLHRRSGQLLEDHSLIFFIIWVASSPFIPGIFISINTNTISGISGTHINSFPVLLPP